MPGFIIGILVLPISLSALADFHPAGSWSSAKNTLDDHVYFDMRFTLYCGCHYISDNDSDGSGDIDADACGLGGVTKKRNVRNTIQWEHIVPASLMPVGSYLCWQQESAVKQCKNDQGEVKLKNRACCDKVSPSGKLMLYDLFNLAPAAAQLNQYRSNDPYGEVPDDVEHEGFGDRCLARDLNGTQPGPDGLFEPPDCKKGDVARTCFYMRLAHGVVISPEQEEMFQSWSDSDPVSPWEKRRHDRIAAIQGNSNPYVEGIAPDPAGACSWEPEN
jgi:deoxyribonuclease-1